MEKREVPQWVHHARGFIAKGRIKDLTAARDACTDQAIQAFLSEEKLAQCIVDKTACEAFNQSLKQQGRLVEAACVQILILRELARFADQPESLDLKMRTITHQACSYTASLSRDYGFTECEAFFSQLLGARAAKLHQQNEANILLRHALDIYRKLAETEPEDYRPDVAMTLNNLGTVLRNQRNSPEARRAFDEAAETYRKLAETKPEVYQPEVATTLNNLGAVLKDQRNFPEARKAFDEALEIRRKLAETEPEVYQPDVAINLNNLGIALRDQRNFPEARKMFDEAAETYRKLAENKPEVYQPFVATTVHNLADVLRDQRNFPEARRAFDEALEIRRKLAETEPEVYQPDVAMTLNNLGIVLRDQRNFSQARKAFEEAAETYRRLAETEPEVYAPNVAGTLSNLGNVLRDQRNFPEARKMFGEAAEIYRKLAETKPEVYQPNVAMTLNHLGIVLRDQGNFPEAQKAFDEALDIRRKLAETEPEVYQPDVAITLNNLGIAMRDERNFLEARKMFDEAAETYRRLAKTDPEVYQPFVAMTLNNLGGVLRDHSHFPAARKAFDEALGIRRKLAETKPKAYQLEVATTLNDLGVVLRKQRDFPAARNAFDEALDICRKLAEREPEVYKPHVAITFNNLGNVLQDQRNFSEARNAFDEALDICRKLAETEPEVYQPEVAMTLNNLGAVLQNQSNFPDARNAFDEALEIRRILAETKPEVYQPEVAGTLNNLAAVLINQRNFPEARTALDEAVDIHRTLAAIEPGVHESEFATTLHNLAALLGDQRNFPDARQAYYEALEIQRKLAETEPELYQPFVAMTLNNLGNLLEKSEGSEAALAEDERAVVAAEDHKIQPSHLWLSKGNATSAYRRRLRALAQSKQPREVFRTLAAMREGPVRSLGNDPDEGLDACAAALNNAESRTGKRLRILVAQGVSGNETLLAVLQANATVPIQFDLGKSFQEAAEQLFQEILTVFDKEDERGYEDRRENIDRLAMEAWNVLPAFVQETLDHRADHTLLVSGDRYWNAFPWELLPCNEHAEFPFLGLHRVLARWSPLTAAAIRNFEPMFFGEGKETAAIFCPWNALQDPKTHLNGSKNEAKNVADRLKEEVMGYHLIPDGDCIAGENATLEAFESVLSNSASLIHYTGHGSILDGEEILVLHNGQAGAPHRPFGRKEISNLKERLGRTKLLEHKPLVVLNSCMTGQTRNFGGQREDLAATFQMEGSEAVIASALPVYDWLGRMFGESLYAAGFASSKGMGQTLVNVRRVVELAARKCKSGSWPAWALLTYYGNPLAQLPHVPEQMLDSEARQSGFFSFLADILHLRDPEEAEALVRRIAN